jgi:hypothetical protein
MQQSIMFVELELGSAHHMEHTLYAKDCSKEMDTKRHDLRFYICVNGST